MAIDVYEIITNRIIEEMEKGIIVWNKCWHGADSGAINRVTKKPYSFLNQMLLKHDGEYATFKQWSELGGKVKKNEKSEIVVFWKQQVIKGNENAEKEEDRKDKVIPMLRYYNVFHISQIEGVESIINNDFKPINHNPIEAAENVINSYDERETELTMKDEFSNKAYYSESDDLVHVPLREQFDNIEEYYSTKFHEITHSTGSQRRLKRLTKTKFGTSSYSKEELVAEIGSTMLMNYCNIDTEKTFKNSVAYLQNWIQVLKNDKKMIVSASSKAEKAVKYVLTGELPNY